MRALVTGSAGFVGRRMCAELERRGWSVSGVDIVDGRDALGVFAGTLFPGRRFDLVVHAAASSPHRAAIDGEPMHFAKNLQLDSAMFDWAVRTGQGRVLYLSSSAAYPTTYQDGLVQRSLSEDLIRFDTELFGGPDAVYGWAKLTGEKLAAAARKARLPVSVVRPFSGYGEDQSEDFPFRALVERACRREDPFTIWGDGQQVRDWVHIDDVIAAVLAVVESGTDEPVNVCTGVGASMVDLARMACGLVGYEPAFAFRTDKPAGVAYRVGDPTVLHEFYKPQISLREGVERALAA